MIEIIPAILPKSLTDLEEHLSRATGVARQVQVDVVDGKFVPNTTWPYVDEASFRQIVVGDQGMPHWEDFDFEFDLMVQNVDHAVADFVAAGATRIIVHTTSSGAKEALEALQSTRGGDLPVEVGVALGSSEGVQKLAEFEGLFDYVQVMGISEVGFQGKPFDEHSLELIVAVRAKYPELPIQVDGGVTLERAGQFVQAGATRLVAGSAIFKADDVKSAYRALYTSVNAH